MVATIAMTVSMYKFLTNSVEIVCVVVEFVVELVVELLDVSLNCVVVVVKKVSSDVVVEVVSLEFVELFVVFEELLLSNVVDEFQIDVDDDVNCARET